MNRQDKHRLYIRLGQIDLSRYYLGDTDARLMEYFITLRKSEDAHNYYEIAAAVRFFDLMDRYEWRSGKVRSFIKFYEGLKFSGLKGRRSYKMTPIQVFQFASMLGFYRPDGRRLVRRAILFVPRKFSKTTSTSSLAVYELLRGDANAQAYTAANGYKQAQVCFKEIAQLIRQLDPKHKYFHANRERISWKENKYGKESFVECLSGSADTKDGLNASLIIFDEYAASKYVKEHSEGAELLQVLESSCGARDDYLTVIITTASRVIEGPFSVELDVAERVLTGEISNDSLFASLFMPDDWELDNPEILGDRRLWHKCNPHIGVTVKESFYEDKYQEALNDQEKMLEFKTKLLNIFVSYGTRSWLEMEEVRAVMDENYSIDKTTGRPPTMVGIDLSVSDDLSAISYMSYSKKLKKFFSQTDFYLPESVLEGHPNASLYRRWTESGLLKICPGKVIDYSMIVSDVLARNRKLKILQIGYDAYKSQEVVNALAAAIKASGTDPKNILRAVPQTFGAFTSPTETMELAIRRQPAGITFSSSPIMAWMAGNCVLEYDRLENKKPVKRSQNAKIDGIISNLECIWLFENYIQRV